MFNFREKLEAIRRVKVCYHQSEAIQFLEELTNCIKQSESSKKEIIKILDITYYHIGCDGYISVMANKKGTLFAKYYKPRIAKRVYKEIKNIISKDKYEALIGMPIIFG